MRYICPTCGEIFPARPPNGTCGICEARLVPESGTQEAETRGENEGLPSPKRRL